MTRAAVAVEAWNAEAAIAFSLTARRFASTVTLSIGGEKANGKDDIEVLTLGPEPGEEAMLSVEGEDEKEAFETLLGKLLGVIELPKDHLAALTRSDPDRQLRPAKMDRRAVAPLGLDLEELGRRLSRLPLHLAATPLSDGENAPTPGRDKRPREPKRSQKIAREPKARRTPRKRKK